MDGWKHKRGNISTQHDDFRFDVIKEKLERRHYLVIFVNVNVTHPSSCTHFMMQCSFDSTMPSNIILVPKITSLTL